MENQSVEAACLRRVLSEVRRSGSRGRYPRELKARILRYAQVRWSAEATTRTVALEVGLKYATLVEWRAALGRKAKSPELRRIHLVAEAKPRGLAPTLHLKGGHYVEGLTLQQLASLVKELQ